MAELLTESFCERCGTRYTFQSSAPSGSPLGRVRTLGKGLRSFVLNGRMSLSEAMADARHAEEISATTTQLDAFHRTFSFCIDCRQYTCGSCWNADDGRCRSCAPLPEDLVETTGIDAPADAPATPAQPEPGTRVLMASPPPVEAWPSIDLAGAPVAPTGAPVAPPSAVPAWPAADLAEVVAEPIVSAEAPASVVEEPVAAAPETVIAPEAMSTRPRLLGMEPGQSLEDAIAQAEARLAAAERATAALEPVLEVALDVEVIARPEPVAGPEVIARPEPVAGPEVIARPEPVAGPEPEPEPVADVAAIAGSAPDAAAPAPAPATWLTVAPDDTAAAGTTAAPAAPQWPTTPAWSGSAASATPGSTLAGRPLVEREDAAAVWAASAREVLTGAARQTGPTAPQHAATPHPCIKCGLPLSANARFCRRCGSRQA